MPSTPPPTIYPPPYEAAYDWLWWLHSWWGHGTDPAPDWVRQLGAVVQLGAVANQVSPQLRGRVMEVALQQVRLVASNLEAQAKQAQQQG